MMMSNALHYCTMWMSFMDFFHPARTCTYMYKGFVAQPLYMYVQVEYFKTYTVLQTRFLIFISQDICLITLSGLADEVLGACCYWWFYDRRSHHNRDRADQVHIRLQGNT